MLWRNDVVAWVPPSLERALGWRPDEWIGQSLEGFGYQEDFPALVDTLQTLALGEPVVLRIRFYDKALTPHWVELHTQTYVGSEGEPDGVLSRFRTVEIEVASASALEKLARFDALTGLLNRNEAIDVIAAACLRRRRPTEHFAVLFCDVDSFKEINDMHGHAAGDEVLRVLASRIRHAVRRQDRVARFGGDEFVVLLDGIHELDEGLAIAETIRSIAVEPVLHDGMAISSSVSIGVTIAQSGEDVERILPTADKAMYEAKHAGRNRVMAVGPTGARGRGSACDPERLRT